MTEYTILAAIGEADEHLLERSEMRHVPRRWTAWAVSAACLCLVTVLAWQIWPHRGADAVDDSAAMSSADTNECTEMAGNAIHVKELKSKNVESAADIGLFQEDFIAMTVEELETYYGTNIQPGWMPEDLTQQGVTAIGVFENPARADYDGQPYYDQNTLTYTDETEQSLQTNEFEDKAALEAAAAQGRSLSVTAAGERGIFYDVVITNLEEARADGELSAINGQDVLLYHYTFQDADFYGARFQKGNAELEVTGKNLTLDELVRVLESLI